MARQWNAMVEQTTAAHGMESGPPTRKGSEKELIGTIT
jgi:hypothetical protein